MDIFGTILLFTMHFMIELIPIIIGIVIAVNVIVKKTTKKKLIFDIITLLICFWYTYVEFIFYIRNREYIRTHAPSVSWSLPTLLTIEFLGIILYLILRLYKKNLPPLVAIILLSSTVICSICMLVFVIQVLFADMEIIKLFFLTVFPINYILCLIKLQIDIIHRYKKEQQYSNKI